MRLIALFLACVLLATPAYADDPPTGAVVTHNGVEGLWFPLPVANRILSDLTEYRSLVSTQIPLLERKLALKDETIALLRHNLALTEQQSEAWRRALEEVVQRPSPRSSIWDNREFWFFTGFISAGVLAIGLSYGLQD